MSCWVSLHPAGILREQSIHQNQNFQFGSSGEAWGWGFAMPETQGQRRQSGTASAIGGCGSDQLGLPRIVVTVHRCCHLSRIDVADAGAGRYTLAFGYHMAVPGTAADVAISCSDSISTVPGTGPRVRIAREIGTPAHRVLTRSGSVSTATHSLRSPTWLGGRGN